MIIVDERTNSTTTTTEYHIDIVTGGKTTLFTRSDTNAAGTVTADITEFQTSV